MPLTPDGRAAGQAASQNLPENWSGEKYKSRDCPRCFRRPLKRSSHRRAEKPDRGVDGGTTVFEDSYTSVS